MTRVLDNRYEQAVAEGRRALGAFCCLDGFAVSHILCAAGFDFVVFDHQHAAYTWPDLENLCFRVRSTGAAAFIRTASIDPAEVALAYDMPVDGVILPNVSSLEEAELAVRTAKLAPTGERSVGNERHDATIGAYHAPEPLLGLLIETPGAVEAIDAIVKLPIDLLWIGTHDLAASLGFDPHSLEEGIPAPLQSAMTKVQEAAFAQGTQFWGYEPGSAASIVGTDARLVRQAALDCLDRARAGIEAQREAVPGA